MKTLNVFYESELVGVYSKKSEVVLRMLGFYKKRRIQKCHQTRKAWNEKTF